MVLEHGLDVLVREVVAASDVDYLGGAAGNVEAVIPEGFLALALPK